MTKKIETWEEYFRKQEKKEKKVFTKALDDICEVLDMRFNKKEKKELFPWFKLGVREIMFRYQEAKYWREDRSIPKGTEFNAFLKINIPVNWKKP